jgi:predicted secreted protein
MQRTGFWALLKNCTQSFSPVATKMGKINGKTVLIPRADVSLTKADLIALYRKCGDILHRGSIQKMDFQATHESEFEQIREWTLKIGELIKSHTINLRDSKNAQLWGHVDDSFTGYMELLVDRGNVR